MVFTWLVHLVLVLVLETERMCICPLVLICRSMQKWFTKSRLHNKKPDTRDQRLEAAMDTYSITSSMTCQSYNETKYCDIDLTIPQVIEIPTPKLEKSMHSRIERTVVKAPRRYRKEGLATIKEETESFPQFANGPANAADNLIFSNGIVTFLEGFSSLLISTTSTAVDQTAIEGHVVAPETLGVAMTEIRLDKLTICRLIHTSQAPSTQKRATHCRSNFVLC